MDFLPLRYAYCEAPLAYTIRVPRKGNARQRRRVVRRRIRIAVLTRRLGDSAEASWSKSDPCALRRACLRCAA